MSAICIKGPDGKTSHTTAADCVIKVEGYDKMLREQEATIEKHRAYIKECERQIEETRKLRDAYAAPLADALEPERIRKISKLIANHGCSCAREGSVVALCLTCKLKGVLERRDP